jgi:hypothetical protein
MDAIVPLWLQLVYTLFVLVLVPVYWKHYGPANFLWFSDIALFSAGIVLWTENHLLLSMTAVGMLALELIWNIDYFGRLLTGKKLLGLSDYMFHKDKSLFLRALSLFHIFLPAILIWLLMEWGYDTRAFYYQTGLAWIVLLLTYFLTDPKENINWVFGPGNKPQKALPASLYFLFLMIIFPLLVFLPSHFLLKWIFN